MARPKLPEELLKNKRRIRPSTTTGKRIENCPVRSEQSKYKWKKIINEAMRGVISNDRIDNIAPKAMMTLEVPHDWNSLCTFAPWPSRNRRNKVITINCEIILNWLYMYGYADWNPNMIYQSLRQVNSMLRDIDNIVVDNNQ